MPVWETEHSGVSDTHGSFLRLVAIPLTSYSGQSTAACRAVIESEFDVIESETDVSSDSTCWRDGGSPNVDSEEIGAPMPALVEPDLFRCP